MSIFIISKILIVKNYYLLKKTINNFSSAIFHDAGSNRRLTFQCLYCSIATARRPYANTNVGQQILNLGHNMRPLHPYKRLFERCNTVFPEPVLKWSVVNYDTHQTQMFASRSAALLHQKTIAGPSQIFFHCFETQMARLNFSTEPSQSLDQLLKERAQELRDSYRYLRLWVSGGSDSMTALNSFIKNNIYVDEIVMHLYDNDELNSSPIFMKKAVIDVAIPFIQKNFDQLKNTKITVYRSNLDTLSQWHVNPDTLGEIGHIDCLDRLGGQLRLPTTGAMSTLEEPSVSSWCDIIGGQKTKICLRNNRWYVYDIDVSFLSSILATTTEDFFISKSVPTLFLKTAWNLRRHCQSRGMTAEEIDNWCLAKNKVIESQRHYNMAIGRISLPDCSYHKLTTAMLEKDETHWLGRTNSRDSRVVQIYFENKKLLALDSQFANESGYLSRFYSLDDGLSYDSFGIW